MPFSKLGLSEHLQKALLALSYAKPYPIQEAAIPVILTGKDVLGIAKTGSGKTASFALPMLERFMDSKTTSNRHVRGLILVPTRELAQQVEEVFKKLSDSLPKRIKTLAVFGGASINPQMINLQGTDILVATPGRLLDLIASKAVYLSEVEMLVLDEADKMLNLGFKEEMQKILQLLPAKRQNILFSATLSADIKNIKDIILHDPEVVEIEAEEESIDQISQIAYHVTPERKGPFLRYLIKQNNMQQVLVFVSSAQRADAVEEKLFLNGIKAAAFHGQKSQGARNEALKQFKLGKIRVLVATDLASRGIDIPFLPYVINYELPRSPKDYVHRIGRTGRADESGEAISLVTDEELHHFKIIQKKMGKRVTLVHTEEVNLHGF
ncbi:DEAD/DEAH box helicase [Williamwhitmania taraxaci]|uniref:ATP-dependent RNA helicase RhlE n=1 Tax=Williamwhitmania taraxaci TaxID=1640674 RepID=A0A1G6T031_9BACT|nr:DEAD/DEAH box helicase [Williamwhitmania taraxaci]SDD21827.1 ATP-dependent RNA helicase RhlE [Williamwhitmania taraxaci]